MLKRLGHSRGMKTTYINGDKVEYVGTSKMLHGAVAYDVVFIEGLRKGKAGVTYRAPGVPHYNGEANQPTTCSGCDGVTLEHSEFGC